jgi:uncharacterized protein (TIGR03032 family)
LFWKPLPCSFITNQIFVSAVDPSGKATNAFAYKHTKSFSEVLASLNCTLLLTTYQAGALLVLSARNQEKLRQLPVPFSRPMGVGVYEDKVAVASMEQVTVFKRASQLIPKAKTYDAVYVPRAVYYTGPVDMHDLHGNDSGWWGVNTALSCLGRISEEFSVDPYWQPSFISELLPEDRCHLNGLAMWEGVPTYATALGASDRARGWRDTMPNGGVLLDIPRDRVLLKELPMPHSPRRYGDDLYFLLSATGQLVRYHLPSGTHEVLAAFTGFVRGMARIDDYLFIGLSKIRASSKNFQALPVAKEANHAGVVCFHIPSRETIGMLLYEGAVEEIYDVQLLTGLIEPMFIPPQHPQGGRAVHGPDFGFWLQPKKASKPDSQSESPA